MERPFEIEWWGGAPERHFRKVRPGVDDLPWGTLDPSRYPPELVDRARVSWTEAAFNEYTTAATFTSVLEAMLAARVPLDLIGMASDFIADEILHVELTSRVAMELGGGAPYLVDFDALAFPLDGRLDARQRANELVVRVCCVGEAFSVPMLAGAMRSASHPLTRAVLERIVKEEAPHAQLGWHYLEWASEEMSDAERRRLAAAALDMIARFSPYWQRLSSRVEDGVTSEGYLLDHVRELGWMESSDYARVARDAVRREIVAPLARFAIELPNDAVDAILA